MSSPTTKSSQATTKTTDAPSSADGISQHDATDSTTGQSKSSDTNPNPQEAPTSSRDTTTINSSQSEVPSSSSTSTTNPATESNPRLEVLNQKKAKLEATLADLRAERASLVAASKLPGDTPFPADWTDEQKTKQALDNSHAVIKEHIALLHRYNEIKDIGQGLMGLIADGRGVRVASVMEEFGIDGKD